MTRLADNDEHPLMTTAEFAELLRVDAATVTRWIREKNLSRIRTPGGHYRIERTLAKRILDGEIPGIDPPHTKTSDDAPRIHPVQGIDDGPGEGQTLRRAHPAPAAHNHDASEEVSRTA
jgi:excisionase family DNA binding protein